jgi:hypothetical protein
MEVYNKQIFCSVCSTICLWFKLRETPRKYWENIKTISTKCTEHRECCNIYCFVIQFEMHILHHTDSIQRFKFGRDRSVLQDTLAEELSTFWWCLDFHWRDFPNNARLSLYVNLLKTICGCLPVIIIKVCHLNSCATGRLYLGCFCRNVPEYLSAITRTFAINCVIVVAISHILSAINRNSNESSGGISCWNGGILLKIHNFHCSHTSTKKQICWRSVSK